MSERSISPAAVLPRTRASRLGPLVTPGIVLIGASTGGPQALMKLLQGLSPILAHVPVCVTLHMPADLMPVIAAHVARTCRVETVVVTGPRRLEVGLVHFAPGDRHLGFHRAGAGIDLVVKAGVPGDYCKPAVDVMFASGAACHGARTVGVVLSGMGNDGLAGARAIVAAGGLILAQDKASSAVWGMPGAVAKADLASAVLAPDAMAREIILRVPRLTRTA